MFNQKTLLSKLPEILGKIRDEKGSCDFNVKFRDDKLCISDLEDNYNSSIINTIVKVTEKQEIPWEIRINYDCDSLEIVLGDE